MMQKTERNKKADTSFITKLALMSAVICVTGPLSINIPISPVPITFGIIGILLSVYVLGVKGGILSVLIYLLLGAFGLPVFSNFSGGFSKIAGPTGGYLAGYILLALISGIFIEKFPKNRLLQFLGIMTGIVCCYALGTVWLKFQANMSFSAALLAGTLPYIPFDIAKAVLCVFLGGKLKEIGNKKRV